MTQKLAGSDPSAAAAASELLGLSGGTLVTGGPGDVVLIDPDREWTYDASQGFSKSRNSPWAGQTLTGRAIATIVGGRLVYDVDRGVLYP